MVANPNRREPFRGPRGTDPRESGNGEAQIIDLATRSVLPAVTQRRGDRFGPALGVLIVAGLGALTLWSMDSARHAARPQDPKSAAVAPQAPGDVLAPRPQVAAAPLVQPAPGWSAPTAPNFARPPEEAGAPGVQPAAQASPAIQPSQTLVYDASLSPSTARTGAKAPGKVTANRDGQDDFAIKMGGTGGEAAVAEATFAPSTTITQGTLIPAVLETAINTDVPGYVRAVVSSDVRSFDGRKVLVPRSSRLIGQYRDKVSAGQKRAYVIWTRLIRPDGVSVSLNSPAVTFSGQTGLEGKVNNHFFARFGSALLLSVVGAASAVGTGGSTLVLGGGQSAAAAAVNQSGQVPPTIRVRQGEPIRVFTAKDLDFSNVS